jgi:Fe-S-cluster containining protein
MDTYLEDGLGVFGVLGNVDKINNQIKYLEKAYKKLPKTLGCVSCGKCCQVQHPHCYYIEFLYMMRHIMDNWDQNKRLYLHLKCTDNYLSNNINKECIFLTKDMMCDLHNVRDFNCRSFGIIPKSEYAKRYEKRKKEFDGEDLCLKRQEDCCSDVRPESYISQSKLDDIFKSIYLMDQKIGVDKISADDTDNYMTFHDHYMLHVYSSNPTILKQLTEIKTDGSDEDKKSLIKDMAISLGVDYE